MIARVLISKDIKDRREGIEKILSKAQIKSPHPDLLYFSADSKLGVEQAKEIREFFSIKPYQAKGRTVILEDASKMTVEAQNALLKTLEEPPEEAILVLGSESEDRLLPTILSRCEIVTLGNVIASETKQSIKYREDIENLIPQDISDRFEYIEKLKEKEEFLHALAAYFHSLLPDPKASEFLRELLQAEEWADNNVNMRGILEYLMLVMPRKKD